LWLFKGDNGIAAQRLLNFLPIALLNDLRRTSLVFFTISNRPVGQSSLLLLILLLLLLPLLLVPLLLLRWGFTEEGEDKAAATAAHELGSSSP
jgi:hypothetical protein